jgi:hypothetical protein
MSRSYLVGVRSGAKRDSFSSFVASYVPRLIGSKPASSDRKCGAPGRDHVSNLDDDILHSHRKCSCSLFIHLFTQSPQNGFAAFLLSPFPLTGSLNSFHETGYITLPSSLRAMMTPNSFRSVAT